VLARLIGRHSRYACVPVEARFHAEPEGLPGLLVGRVTPGEFANRMRDHWWQRIDSSGREAGLDRIATRELFDGALAEFEHAVGGDPAGAGARLVRRLLGGVADAEHKDCWIEMTPSTALNATSLLRLFPDMRIVHVVRDGRDVAASVARLWGWDPEEALEWWLRRVRRVFLEQRQLPAGTMLTLRLERLVVSDRERRYAELLEFLQLEDEPEMRRFFEERVSPARMRTGPWSERMSESRGLRLAERYREMLAELEDEVGELASELTGEP
jgi:hypothetical protein